MSELLYYALWLAIGLGLVTLASAAVAWRGRRGEQRRAHAVALLDALASHAAWVASQGRLPALELQRDLADAALAEAARLQAAFYPELAAAMRRLVEVDAALWAFLNAQQRLRLADPEAWLDSDHDTLLAGLLQQYEQALQALVESVDGSAAPSGRMHDEVQGQPS